jgi:Chaperone of endosialidase
MGLWETIKNTAVTLGTGGMIPAQGYLAGKAAQKYGPGIMQGLGDALDRSKKAEELYGGVDPTGQLGAAAGAAGEFGRAGASNYAQSGQQLQGTTADMRRLASGYGKVADQYGRIAGGEDSISALQLRQGLGQSQGQQMSQIAAARPQDASMAALAGARNMGDAAAGLGGQQAVAGLQERRDAMAGQMGAMGGQAGLQQAIQTGQLGQRGQDINVALGGQQGALTGYGNIEGNRTNRYGALVGQPTFGEQLLQAGQAGGQLAMMASDPRLKTDIKDGEEEADELVKALKSYTFRYKDEDKHGDGEFLGLMTSDLKKSRLGRRAVVETPEGEFVHGARLATALAATLPGIDKRIAKLEKRRG